MKVAPALAAALVIYIAIPGSNQGKGKKPKPKFCRGANGNQYKKGESYEDEEACIRYTCTKKGKTFKMKEEKIQCTEPEPELAANVTAIEASVQFLNNSMESIGNKMEALQSNVSLIEAGMQFLNGSMESVESKMESLQTSVESILGMITAMQSTSNKLEDGAWSAWSSYSACSATCGHATKYRTRTCSDPAPANGGKPCPGLNLQTMDCQLSQCGEPEPELAANVTAIEASVQFLNSSMESIGNKMEALQSNVSLIDAGMQFLNSSMESVESKMEALQTSVESILGMITAMQSTSSKLEVNITSNMDAISSNKEAISSNKNTCSAIETTAAQLEVNITSNMDAISSNKEAIFSNKVDISTNNNGINTNKDTCSAIETTAAKLETCLGDVNSTECPSSENGKISVVDAIKGNKEGIEALEIPKFNLALIAGYNYGGSLATSEIMSPGGVCSQGIPPLPVAVYGHQSVYFNNTLMVCGGTGQTLAIKKCYQLRGYNSEWTEGPAMNTLRKHFTMTKAGQDLYALGGLNGNTLDSMEKLSESSGEWAMMAQKLTSPRRKHCTVFMETTRSLVIIGGYPYTNLVEEFSVATATWKELAPLPVAVDSHACMVLGNSIVVTGGSSNSAGKQKKVYTFAGGQWATTGELQQAKYHHSMATLDNKVLVLGGVDGGSYVDTIEEMQLDGSFRVMEWKLKEKRGYSAATQVPREMFPCY